MRKALIPALLLVIASFVLGATVFREQVANAATALNVFVSNDSAHPVPVHEQGTAAVRSANSELSVRDVFVGQPFGPTCKASGALYSVPAGQQLVVLYVAATGSGNRVNAEGENEFTAGIGNLGLTVDVFIPLLFQDQTRVNVFHEFVSSASESVHYVVAGPKTLSFGGEMSNSSSCAFEVALGGYLQPIS